VPGYTLDDGITLKNKLGATSHGALEVAEADYVSNRPLQMEPGHGPTGQFDVAHLRSIHRHLFQDVYECSGRTREERVALLDGTIATEPSPRKIDGGAFMAGPINPERLDRIAGSLRDANYLRGQSRKEFARHAAGVMIDLSGVHPFREGNGRAQRAFMRALAIEAGHELDFSVISSCPRRRHKAAMPLLGLGPCGRYLNWQLARTSKPLAPRHAAPADKPERNTSASVPSE